MRAQGRRIKRGLDELRELDAFSASPKEKNEHSQKRRRKSTVLQRHESVVQEEEKIINKGGTTPFSSNVHQQLVEGDNVGSSFSRLNDRTFDENLESVVLAINSRKDSDDSGGDDHGKEKGRPKDVSTISSPHLFNEFITDWKEAKKLLFTVHQSISNDSTLCATNSKRQFLEYCELWHARSRANRLLPGYIEATELLVQAMLVDQFQELSPFSSVLKDFTFFNSTRMVCLYYGAALSRIVHVLTGSFTQTDSLNTYRKRAKEVGLPEEVVEVRQRVAHGTVPSITELRWVASMTLQYLFQEHWVPEERRFNQQLKEAQNKSNSNKKNSEATMNEGNMSDNKKFPISAKVQTCTEIVVSNPQRNIGDKKNKTSEEKIAHEDVRDIPSASSNCFSVMEIKSFLESLNSLPAVQLKEDREDDKYGIEKNVVSGRVEENKREFQKDFPTEVMRRENSKEVSNSSSCRPTREKNDFPSKGREKGSIWKTQCMGWSIL